MTEEIKRAEKIYEAAAKALVVTIERTYPVGCVVGITFNGPVGLCAATVEVTGHGSWWSNPSEIRGVNVDTGGQRKFLPSDVVRVVSWGSANMEKLGVNP